MKKFRSPGKLTVLGVFRDLFYPNVNSLLKFLCDISV